MSGFTTTHLCIGSSPAVRTGDVLRVEGSILFRGSNSIPSGSTVSGVCRSVYIHGLTLIEQSDVLLT